MSQKPMPGSRPGGAFDRDELLDSLEGIVWALDLNTSKFTFVSAGAERILGYPLSDWGEGMDFWARALHPEDREEAVRFCLEKTRALEDHTFEYRMLAADGRIVWIRDLVTVCRKDGAAVGLQGMMIDISDHKRLEAELRESRARYRAVVEDQTELIVRFLPDGTRTFVNDAYCRYFAAPAPRLLGEKVYGLLCEEDRDAAWQRLAALTPEAPTATVEHQVRLPGGELRWHLCTLRAFFDNDRQPVEFQATGRDISSQKLALEAQRTQEELLRAAFANTVVGMAIIDPDGLFFEVNEAFGAIFGYQAAELKDASFLDLTHPDDRESCRDFLLDWTEGSKAFLQTEKRYLHRDGRVLWGQVSFAVINDLQGRPARVVCQLQDVTEAKRTREELILFQFLINRSNDAIFIVDPASAKPLYVNDKACDNLGYERSELLQKRVHDYAENIRDDRDWRELHDRLRRQGRTFFEAWQRRRDGTRFPVEVNISLVQECQGEYLVSVARDVTERRRMEEALQEEKNKVEAIVEAMGDGIAAMDREFRIIYQNGVHRSRQGDHIGERCYRAFHGRDAICDSCALDVAFASGDIQHRVVDVKALTGDLSLEVTACPLRNAAGEIVAGVEVVRDVTERKRTEEALRNSERRYRAVIEEMTELLCRFRPDGVLTFVNDAYCRFFQLERQQLLGRNMLKLVAAEDRAEVLRHLAEVSPDHSVVTMEIRVLAPGGLARWQRWTGRAFFDDAGCLVEVQANGHDVTARKLTEDLLRQSEHRFRRLSNEFQTLLDGIPDSIVHLDPEYRILWANSAAQKLFTCRDAPLVMPHCYQAFHGFDVPCPECPVSRALLGQNLGVSEVIAFADIFLEIRTFPMREPDGKVSSVIVLKRDVTEKVKMEQEAMRTAHLISLGELAAGVAHEINNPINGIINYAQILQDRIDEKSRNRELTERILKEGDRIGAIVSNLLFFARHDSDSRVPVSIRDVLMDALFLAQPQLRRDQVQLELAIDTPLPSVLGVPQKIEQVFLNILHNARDALNEKFPDPSPEKLIRVTTTLEETSGRPSRVRIVFEDRGNGIRADILPRVTNPFFTTKPAGKGTGLGLSISHNIVVDHGGHLTVESEPGRFTRIRIDFPACTKEGD